MGYRTVFKVPELRVEPPSIDKALPISEAFWAARVQGEGYAQTWAQDVVDDQDLTDSCQRRHRDAATRMVVNFEAYTDALENVKDSGSNAYDLWLVSADAGSHLELEGESVPFIETDVLKTQLEEVTDIARNQLASVIDTATTNCASAGSEKCLAELKENDGTCPNLGRVAIVNIQVETAASHVEQLVEIIGKQV